jgi:hypothetical protein
MKKIFTILSLALSTAAFSQVTVTYQVDITEYIAGGATLNANGIRVGGNFTTAGASIPDWTPSDAACAMTDLGNGLWSIAVTYPATSVGTTQLYKFVNGDWGTNEGVATSLIAEDQCGTDDGGGNINRTLVIPATNTTVTFCWDKCAACISSIDEVNKVNVVAFPNPATDVVNFQVDAADYVITLTDLAGKTVATSTTSTIEMSGLSSGAYLYKVVTNNGTATGKVTKK